MRNWPGNVSAVHIKIAAFVKHPTHKYVACSYYELQELAVVHFV